jgi:hypothetical protein
VWTKAEVETIWGQMNYLTNFNYFLLKIVFRKMLDMVRTGKKMTILKGVVDSFSYENTTGIYLPHVSWQLSLINEKC